MEYGTFVRAFQNIIESKTSSSSERFYYLEQFTSGDVKELVQSCHYLPPERGYQEARRLMKKKFGDDYRMVTAYETKVLKHLSGQVFYFPHEMRKHYGMEQIPDKA